MDTTDVNGRASVVNENSTGVYTNEIPQHKKCKISGNKTYGNNMNSAIATHTGTVTEDFVFKTEPESYEDNLQAEFNNKDNSTTSNEVAGKTNQCGSANEPCNVVNCDGITLWITPKIEDPLADTEQPYPILGNIPRDWVWEEPISAAVDPLWNDERSIDDDRSDADILGTAAPIRPAGIPAYRWCEICGKKFRDLNTKLCHMTSHGPDSKEFVAEFQRLQHQQDLDYWMYESPVDCSSAVQNPYFRFINLPPEYMKNFCLRNMNSENEYSSHYTSSFVLSVAIHDQLYGLNISKFQTDKVRRLKQMLEMHEGTDCAKINVEGLKCPIGLTEVPDFEILNKNLSINVFRINVMNGKSNLIRLRDRIHHLYLSPYTDRPIEINLLLVFVRNDAHFILCPDLDLFLTDDGKGKNKMLFCRVCFEDFPTETEMFNHNITCKRIKYNSV